MPSVVAAELLLVLLDLEKNKLSQNNFNRLCDFRR